MDDVMQSDGTIKRQQVSKKLEVDYGGEYRTKASVRKFAQQALAPINSGLLIPKSTMLLTEFIEKVYIPEHVEKLHAASIKQYKDIWRNRVKARIGGYTLREFRTFHGQQIMDKIAERDGLGHSSLCHARAFLSGAFKEALRKGYLEGYSGAKHEPANPMQNVKVPATPQAETDTYAYSPDETKAMLSVLRDPAWTIVLTAARTGLNKAEIRGLRWEDFGGQTLTVRRSVWNKFENAPKTRHRKAPVPVRKQLAAALEAHRVRMGKLAQPSLPIFQAGNGKPLNLDNLVRRVIVPALTRCAVCGKREEEHKPEAHLFERDNSLPRWHGWHAFRRGLATTLNSRGVDDKDIQGIMRHSDIRLTQNIYMKSLSKSRIAAMDTLESTDETCTVLAPSPKGPVN